MTKHGVGRLLVGAAAALGWVAACQAPQPVAPPRAGQPAAPRAAAVTSQDASAPRPLAPDLSRAQICALPAGQVGEPLSGIKPFAPAIPRCPSRDPFCDVVEKSPDPADTCFVASDNIARAEAEAMHAGAPGPARPSNMTSSGPPPNHDPAPAASSVPWDRKARPAYWERVDSHLHLSAKERELLDKNGFVAIERLEYASYATAYHDIFQQQLPVFISIDSVLHSVFQSNSIVLKDVEVGRLGPKLWSMLSKLRATLKRSAKLYGAETSGDLDVYLSVALALFDDSAGMGAQDRTLSLFANDEQVRRLVGKAIDQPSLEPVSLFGRERMIDFSQFAPRGHYALEHRITLPRGEVGLAAYFRAMSWLSKLEFNLVSRSCRSSQPGEVPNPSETPREARDMLALADLAKRSGVLNDLNEFEKVYSVFAGRREDVSVPELLRLAQKGGFNFRNADAPDRLKAAIGNDFRRSARVHYMPQGSAELPAIGTLFGPRIVPDIAPLAGLVHDKLPERFELTAADVAVTLGHDRAKRYLKHPHPGLDSALKQARTELQTASSKRKDLYGLWISAVRALSEPGPGTRPAFMKSEAYADFRINSALVGYGQIRHNYVLLAGQGYDAYGCEIPDAFVEPALATYDALLEYVRAARKLDAQASTYFRRVEQVLGMLRSIVVTELSGRPLSEPQRRWLGMVAEYIPEGGYSDSGEPPKYTGWYFDLFPDRELGAQKAADFVADYFTLTNAGKVRYLGADRPRLGVFVVDVGGEPRAMVGPVAKGYEVSTPISTRLNDESARSAPGKSADWLGYFSEDIPEPRLTGVVVQCDAGESRVVLKSPDALGLVSVALLDHHGDALTASVTESVGPDNTLYVFKPVHKVEGVHLRVHDLAASRRGSGPFDAVLGVSAYRPHVELEASSHPFRPFEAFGFGGLRAPSSAAGARATMPGL